MEEINYKEEAEKILESLYLTYSIINFPKGFYFELYFSDCPIYRLKFKNREFTEESYKDLYSLANNMKREVCIGSYRTKKTLLEYCMEKPIGINSDYYCYSLLLE